MEIADVDLMDQFTLSLKEDIWLLETQQNANGFLTQEQDCRLKVLRKKQNNLDSIEHGKDNKRYTMARLKAVCYVMA